MTETVTACQEACDACRPVGLSILPLRYALAWNGNDVPADQRVPRLSEPFSASYPDLGRAPAHYGARLLRAGYLYVFDEQADEWTAYEVDEGGYLRPFDFFGTTPPPETGETAAIPCGRYAGNAMARCIKINDAANAKRIWLAMTDTAWTDAVKDDHQNPDFRGRHMRCIDVGAWVSTKGKAQPHAQKLDNVFEQVAEYALEAPAPVHTDAAYLESQSTTAGVTKTLSTVQARASLALVSSPFPLAGGSRSDFLGLLWGNSPDDPAPAEVPPMMVALDDPAGVAAELGAMMNDRIQVLLTEKQNQRPLALSAAIDQLREAVGQQHVYDSIEMADQAAERQSAHILERTGSTYFPQDNAFQLDATDLASIRAKSWDGYAAKYDVAAEAAWKARHKAELERLDQEVIFPLATAHVLLMQSPMLRLHMACNYDPGHMHSGVGYQAVVTRAIIGTQDKSPCAELYEQWMQGDIRDRNNMILRAYALNLDQMADKVAEAAAEARFKLKDLPWDSLPGLYAEAGNQIGQAGLHGSVAALIETTVGPFAKLAGQVVDGTARVGLQALTALGVGVARPVEWVSTRATTREIVTGVMEAMAEAGHRKARRRAIKLELRRLQILGVNLNKRHTVGFVGIREDGSMVTRASYKGEKAAFIRGRLSSWRRIINTDIRAGTAAAMLQTLAMVELYKKATGGMRHERGESWARFGAAAVGTFGGALELSGKQLEKVAESNLRYSRWVTTGRTLAVIGRGASALGGFALAAMDIVRANQELREGNEAMANLYWASGISSGLLTAAVLFGAFALAAALFVVVIALALAIMWMGDDSRHDWLERTMWGRIQDSAQRYETLEVEIEQYAVAVGAG